MAQGNRYRRTGPSAVMPQYGLMAAAQFVDERDASGNQLWLHGVCLDAAPCGPSIVDEPRGCDDEGNPIAAGVKDGASQPPVCEPCFDPFTVYQADECDSAGIVAQVDEFTSRLMQTHLATRGTAIEAEFWCSANNPSLTGDCAEALNTDPTNAMVGLALLEDCIASSGRRGFIHMSQEAFTKLACGCGQSFVQGRDGRLRTLNGNTIVVGTGYGDHCPDAALPAPGPNQDWMIATGPVQISYTDPILMPGDISQALDRGTNTVTYRAESHALVAWDLCLHCAVLVDLCQGTC